MPQATLVLLRHGQSEWNEKNLFTGWVDVDLTELGRSEAVAGGEQLRAAGLLLMCSTPRCSSAPSARRSWRSTRRAASGFPCGGRGG